MNKNFAAVKVRLNSSNEIRIIPISSPNKPIITNKISEKWQKIINILAESLNIPAALIMHLESDKISVFLSSQSKGNPYTPNAYDHLQHGLYCETVVGLNKLLLVPNASIDTMWANNPDIKLGMISYLGFPIQWPDGEIFGTICVLDNKENKYSPKYIHLMEILKETIENDLQQMLENYTELKHSFDKLTRSMELVEKTKKRLIKSVGEKELLLSEIHHRVKNNLQIISSFLDLQLNSINNDEIKNQFATINSRILTMGLVHEILYKANDFAQIHIKEYISLLSKTLSHLFISQDKKFELFLNIDENLKINLDTAIPLGLITNEILTNSFKHGLSRNNEGKIIIEILNQKKYDFMLKISDNGTGDSLKSIEDSKGLGIKIIKALVEQLNGEMELQVKNGTSYSIMFNEVKKDENRWLKKS